MEAPTHAQAPVVPNGMRAPVDFPSVDSPIPKESLHNPRHRAS